jgi:hypothetical protein
MKEAKKKHYSRLTAKSNNNIKTTWKHCRERQEKYISGTDSHLTCV